MVMCGMDKPGRDSMASVSTVSVSTVSVSTPSVSTAIVSMASVAPATGREESCVKICEVRGNLFDAEPGYALAHCVSADFTMAKG